MTAEPPSAVEKVLLVLDAVTTERRLSDICRATGLPLSTAHRILNELVAAGWVRQDHDRGYAPHTRLLGLAGRLINKGGHAELVRHAIQRLNEITGYTIHLGVRQGDQVLYTEKLDGQRAYQMRSYIGQAVHLHSTGMGKAILACLPEPEVTAIAARTGLPAMTPATITDPAGLMAHLAQIRARGWAWDDGENEQHTRCIAAAVLDDGGVPVAGISISGLEYDLSLDRAAEFAAPLLDAAEEIGRAFGAAGARP
ncbi:IclR family transcriptional regulator [Phytohabitans kaempferiae]|uniref:IclR family transcriptional regulator n=1 Tax=Phytohabitans kaempferiae TaxID=1620943 RepID=A0ABV6LW77_9ACTN